MGRTGQIIKTYHANRGLYKFWLWPWLLLTKLARPVHPGVFLLNFIVQRIFRVNAQYKFMVHYTSYVSGNVVAGKNVWNSFAASGGCYIQGDNGVILDDDTIFGPGVKIISANHDPEDLARWKPSGPVRIGKGCWIGANAVILPGVELGDRVIVGAGSVVTRSFPQNSVIGGVPARIIVKS